MSKVDLQKPVVLIPAYKPSRDLIKIVGEIVENKLSVIVVDDGSPKDFQSIFSELELMSNVRVIHHSVNLGKGAALKTGFGVFLNENDGSLSGVVTADADGQHSVQDIIKVTNTFYENLSCLVLGARSFKKNVPFRSKFGNRLTGIIFRLASGISLCDTQTGLRGIPKYFIPDLLKINTSGYDFELDMLMLASRLKLKVVEIPITTIYHDGNNSSHFNPLVDSLKIYFVFFRFSGFAMLCGLADYLIFLILFSFTNGIFSSELIARIFSGVVNYISNRRYVFKSQHSIVNSFIKYVLLIAANLIISYCLIMLLLGFGVPASVGKMISLLSLSIVNFFIQKFLIF